MRVHRRIYGPHPKARGARVLLAHAGQEVSQERFEELLAIEAGSSPAVLDLDDDGRSGFVADAGSDVDPVEEPADDDSDVELDDELDDQSEIRHVGGGWYELPDGQRVHGREAAEAVLAGEE